MLLEVLVAMVLLGLALGPLCESLHSARHRIDSDLLEYRAGAAFESASRGSAGWTWGPGVGRAWWEPGQTLALEIVAEATARVAVGMWADGWFIDEFECGTGRPLEIKVAQLGVEAGMELVVRVRESAGAWGPPFRSVAPPAIDEMERPTVQRDPGREAVPLALACIVHMPSLANPALLFSDDSVQVDTDASCLPTYVTGMRSGRFSVGLGGIEQYWRADERRALDVYFEQ